jgi:MYXO-CTERM domain-containing protein
MPAERTRDASLLDRCLNSLRRKVESLVVSSDYDRATRWGGNFWMPLVTGQGSTPLIDEVPIARAIFLDRDPAFAESIRSMVHTTADYFLGTNPLNATWLPRLGARHVRGIFRLDSWWYGSAGPTPGFIPYGPTNLTYDMSGGQPPHGPWQVAWITVGAKIYPDNIDQWPGHERWFDLHTAVMSSETTIDQTNLRAAVVYGSLLSTRYEPVAGTGGASAGGAAGTTGGASAGGGAPGTGGTGNVSASGGSGATGSEDEADSSSGCACRSAGHGAGSALLWLVAIPLLRRRRRA